MLEIVKKYLSQSEKDYNEGLNIFTQISKNRILFQRLSRKPWPEKLEYELEKWLSANGEPIKPAVKKAVEVKKQAPGKQNADIPDTASLVITDPAKIKIIKNKREVLYKDLPKDLQKRWDENAGMYKESRSLHEKLKLLKDADKKILEPIVGRLVDLVSSVRENWNVIDAWNPDQKDLGRLILTGKRLSSNRKAISENLKKLENDPTNIDVRRKLQERITEMKAAGEGFKSDMIERFKSLDLDLG
jgi:hypothetical protein